MGQAPWFPVPNFYELREHRIMKQIIENKETEFRILDMKGGSNENK